MIGKDVLKFDAPRKIAGVNDVVDLRRKPPLLERFQRWQNDFVAEVVALRGAQAPLPIDVQYVVRRDLAKVREIRPSPEPPPIIVTQLPWPSQAPVAPSTEQGTPVTFGKHEKLSVRTARCFNFINVPSAETCRDRLQRSGAPLI